MYPEEVYELKFIPNELKRSIAYHIGYSRIRNFFNIRWCQVEKERQIIKIEYFFKNHKVYTHIFRSNYIYNGKKWVDIRVG